MTAPAHEHGPVVLVCGTCDEAFEMTTRSLDEVIDQLNLPSKVTTTITTGGFQ